ncbi:hypothetical protein ADL00_45350 [Streptomyces sp. AS58]|nr:hypothetical protein ADL00_45350 [Streptomyces sp. AS58]
MCVFEHTSYNGAQANLGSVGCLANLKQYYYAGPQGGSKNLNDSISSIISRKSSSFYAYADTNYQGQRLRVDPGWHENLGYFGMNDKISSFC